MDLSDDPGTSRLRSRVQEWLARELPAEWLTGASRELSVEERWKRFGRDWERRLFDAGFNGWSWPAAVGGQGGTVGEEVVLLEEFASHDVPESINSFGKNMLGPTLIVHGSEAQKQRFLPPLLRGDEIWCQGFSEPNAGSDVAGVETRADRDNTGWRITGQKIWTSYAHRADWIFALVRSNRMAEKHSGLSFMLIDLSSPGVTVRPIRRIDGNAEFNEVFFDSVLVPDGNVVGAPGDGWKVARTTLSFERGTAHFGRYIRFRRQLDQLAALARSIQIGGAPASSSPIYRQRLMQSFAENEVYRLLAYRQLTLLQTKPVGPEGSATKLFWNEMFQRIQALAMELAGQFGDSLNGSEALDHQPWLQRYIYGLSRTIAGGTSEIQRNIVAERILGLPR